MTDCVTPGRARRPLLVATFLALLAPRVASAAGVVASAGADDLADVARSLSRGSSMRIEGATLDERGVTGLDLVRFEPVAAGARFVLQTADGPRSAKPAVPAYFRGSVDGLKGAVAVLSVHPSGELRGLVSSGEGTWMLSRSAGRGSAMRSRRVDPQGAAGARKFECETLRSPKPARTASAALPAATAQATTSASLLAASQPAALPIAYTAQVAVELDYDYYLQFAPDADAAILYALDLMAFTGSLGEAELGMNVQVPFLQLWTTSGDPYSSTSSTTRLGQVLSRWNQAGALNCGGFDCNAIARSTVLLLSGAPTGGVAYLPGLCDSWHSPTDGFAYAYAGSISGAFDIDAPSVVWDAMVTTHELGHNFGSPHSHCYDPPVDKCYGTESGCWAGATSALPLNCPGTGTGCATIMSYCHLQSPGISNISLTWGAGHPYGDDPDRVPATMMDQIAIEAAAAPGCLAATDGMVELEVVKAGSGDGTVTSAPSSVDCGSACRTYFNTGTVVTLTATAGTFSQFTGWSGDPDCSDGVVTLNAATSCVATFDGDCGGGNANCDDGNPCTTDSCPGDDHCENLGTPRDPGDCFDAGRATLKIVDSADPNRDKLIWQWSNGAAFGTLDLGEPSSSTTYRLCVYDSTLDAPRLAGFLEIPAAAPSWNDLASRGWLWKDNAGSYDGIRKLQLKPGDLGRTKVKLLAAGTSLALPGPFSGSEFFDEDTTVTVQLFADEDRCWTSSFAAGDTSLNSIAGFRAKGD